MPLTTESALRKDRTAGYAKMEHRHFATIAAIFHSIYIHSVVDDDTLRVVREAFADELAETNPRFDRKRFLAACR